LIDISDYMTIENKRTTSQIQIFMTGF